MVVNKGLVLDENSLKKLTTLQLSASDQDSEPAELVFHVSRQPSLGHLEHVSSPGRRNHKQKEVEPSASLHLTAAPAAIHPVCQIRPRGDRLSAHGERHRGTEAFVPGPLSKAL